MVRVGLIGLGKMGISHCAILNAHKDVELVAVCDTSKFVTEVLKQHTKFEFFSDYRKMLEKVNLDAVVIASPTRLHVDMIEQALDKNCHVFCEKPLTLTPEDSRRVTSRAEEAGLVTQVGFHNKFIGAFQRMHELVEKGVIGDIVHVHGEAYGPVVLKEKGGTWRAVREEGGGCVYDYAIHVIDLMNWMVGKPKQVKGTILQNIFSKSVDDAVYANLFYEKGFTGQLSINWSDESYRKMSTKITIVGKMGNIMADAQECRVFARQAVPEEGLEKGWNIQYITDLTEPVDFYLRGEEYSAQIDHFINSIQMGRQGGVNSFFSSTMADEVVGMLINDASERC